MNKSVICLSLGLEIAAIACVARVAEENHPCPCASQWTCCASTNVCVPDGTTCPSHPTSDGAAGVTVPGDAATPSSDGHAAVSECIDWTLREAGQLPAGAFGVAVGDLNRDGRPDIVAGDLSSLHVLLGNGDGTFKAPATYPVHMGVPQSIAIDDLDGDGNPDLAIANQEGLLVFLGKGDGTFQPATSYPSAGDSWVAVGDINDDGKLDVAFATAGGSGDPDSGASGAGGVAVRLGNGDGTFQPQVAFPTGSMGLDLAMGDLNGDRRLDLAVVDLNPGGVSVLLGRGDGTFETAVAYDNAATSSPTAVAIGDFNGDGKPDLAVANGGADVLLGNGDGTFHERVQFPTDSSPDAIAVSDLYGDGKLDLVVANQASNNVSVLLGRGDGTFETEMPFATGMTPQDVAIGDLDGDGRPDLAVANANSGSVSVLLTKCGP